MLNIDEVALKESIAERVADRMIDEESIIDAVNKKINDRISNLFADRVDAIVNSAIDTAISHGLDREYQRINQWGEPQGSPTTIKSELQKMIGDYWSARVSTANGKSTDSTYNTVSRAEYVMMTVCGDKFSEDMKKVSLNIAGHLKDGLRVQMAKHMDDVLNELFRVKSLMDQGKVDKPY